ncbi:hypothetical protein K432DRAFT_394323 [Lepidopterella palustris CBS 459.81]|uniref:Uncharacterized protein n=1 Tax=Lepidopterella palustris CBS 459.81 TaxID=1314670 RepID=A0A8E2E879_9PEZI|nr:hypothetical protein K432DRAFT_394323 [Lepidopterella palustris CBS 459.81]
MEKKSIEMWTRVRSGWGMADRERKRREKLKNTSGSRTTGHLVYALNNGLTMPWRRTGLRGRRRRQRRATLSLKERKFTPGAGAAAAANFQLRISWRIGNASKGRVSIGAVLSVVNLVMEVVSCRGKSVVRLVDKLHKRLLEIITEEPKENARRCLEGTGSEELEMEEEGVGREKIRQATGEESEEVKRKRRRMKRWSEM